ncbi:MAG: secretin N-terminal domain-containing protein, partial [FCB group bacterium]|nr:secretin N-terminal domain-containing protein [FCB group bacterium]
MRHIRRTPLAITLLAATVALVGAAVQSHPDAEARYAVLRTCLEQAEQSADNAVLRDAAARARLLTAVTFGDPAANAVVLQTSGTPLFDYVVLEDGKKVVVDVYDTLNGLSAAKFVPESKGPVREVRASMFSLEPRFVSRVTFSLSRICNVRFKAEEGAIRVEFSSPQEGMSSSGSARILAGHIEDRMRRVAVKQSGVEEVITRWNARRAALEANLDSDFSVVATMLADGKRGALAERLRDAMPREDQPVCAVNPAPDGELAKTDRAVATQKTELKAALAALREKIEAASVESAAHARKITERLQYDLNAVRALEERLSTKEGAKDPQALDIVHVMETKLERLQGEDLGPFENGSAACEAAIAEHRAALETATARLGAVRVALTGILASRSNTAAPAAIDSDGSDMAVAALRREVTRLRKSAGPATPAAEIVRNEISVSALRMSPSSVVVAPADMRVAALTTQLEAVQAAQLKLASSPIAPLAALVEGDGFNSALLLAQATDEPVITDEPAEDTETAEAASVPEEAAQAPAPTAEPAPAEDAAPPAPPALVEVPPAPPVKSEIVVTPTAEDGAGATGDITSLNEPVNLDLREMELSNFVALLARKAGINVIAGTELSGTVTASIRNVPLIQAMQMVLRMHDLGVVEEEGVYRIIPYEDAMASERVTQMITLTSGNVEEVKLTLDNILMNAPDGKVISVAANPGTNVLIISGPPKRVDELRATVEALDVAKPVTPTITEAIKLNYALPDEVLTMVQGMLTKEEGKASVDLRGRHIIVTDVPPVIEQVRNLVHDVDTPTKQVSIESMIVDAVLSDAAETGLEWTLNAVQHLNTRGEVIGSLQQGSVGTSLGNVGTEALNAGLVNFNVLTGDINLKAAIAAEASSRNAKILANPQIVILENEVGNISIVDEYPYQEITQSTQGPP